ncbi:MAG: hypothetical protein J1E78_04415 [Muribaculaceae bacterium]|nr:hypothetical protein [Muribaculaceae bacterium]
MGYLRSRPPKDLIAAAGFLIVLCLLVFSAVWVYKAIFNTPPYVDSDKYPVRGIDVSHHNGIIDFNKVADSGVEFVFMKASEGITHRDSLFKRNYEEARKVGLKTGAYHYFRFDCDGVEQAVNFLRAVGPHHYDLGLVIDVESSGNADGVSADVIKNRLVNMVDYMNLLGYRVMIYTNFDGYYDFIEETMPGCPLWICRFKENPINAEWTFWQYDHHGKVPGVKGDVDINVFCGGTEQWENYLQGGIWPYKQAI